MRVALLPVLLVCAWSGACLDSPPPAKAPSVEPAPSSEGPSLAGTGAGVGHPGPDPHAAALQIDDLALGTGPAAKSGDAVRVHYVGTLVDGKVFDSSRDRGTPFSFILGEGKVIRGWEQGIVGMKVGGHRKLTIPPELGYGHAGQPPTIPPDATLLFDVELLTIVQ